MSIVTATLNPCIDAMSHVDRVVPEQKLRCSRPKRYPGGGGINVARAVHRLGGSARALWSRGGPTGEILARLLDDEGVEHRALPIRDYTRENLIVREDASGQHYRFGMPGPELGDAELDAWRQLIAGLSPAPSYLVLSGSLPVGVKNELYAELVACAPKSSKVVLDTSGAALGAALKQRVFLVKPNMGELARLSDTTFRSNDEVAAAARSIVDRGEAQAVLVSLGRGGALLVTADLSERIHAPAVQMDSKVGAGDSMVGGLVVHLARGGSLSEAARYGVAAGTAAIMTPGTELCRKDDTERLFAEIRRE